jgi:hypothetical protein
MANHHEAPETIMFVRHGEKPGEGTRPHGSIIMASMMSTLSQ